jgi:PAS domain S-box-containing protein
MSRNGSKGLKIGADEVSSAIESRLRLIIDTIPTMVWSVRADGAVDFVNQRWLDYTGLTLEEEIEDPTRVVHPEDLPRVMEKWLADMTAGEPSEDEMRLQGADGEYRWFLVRTVPLRDEKGNVVKWYGVSIDIEDRKRAESLSRTLLDVIPQQIWSGPADGTLDYCNEGWRSYMGLGLEELQGDGWQSMLHPDDRERVLRAWHDSVANGTPYEQEERHRGADGLYRWFLSRGVPLRDYEGRILRWYGTNTDIEGRKRTEEELLDLSGQLLRSQDEERRRIAQDLHDSTGQNLVALATMLGRLNKSVPSVGRKSRTLLSECVALSNQCIREVRTLSYLLHPPLLDEAGLEEAIREYVTGFSKRSGIEVKLEMSRRLGRVARDIEQALFRVVQEALTNIQRHSGSQQAKIRIHRNSDLTLEVSDLGRGVSASAHRGKQKTRFEVGVGILSMQERVKLIGGRLDIVSTDHGTTVRATVPFGRNQMKKLRILLADDHGLVRVGARAVLQSQHGWRVVGEAVNGREAVEKAIELKPDVAVVDIGMPELDGIEVTRQIRTSAPETRVLVLTMHESGQMVRRALDAGASGYLLKSDLTESLAKAVETVADGNRFLPPKVSEIVMEEFLSSTSKNQQGESASTPATPREVEVIRLLAEGKTNKEIAALLGITVRTVETHRAKIMLKLGLHSLAELIHYAVRRGIATVQGG